ncbi:RPM1 interacting protein 4 transcript 2 [Striga asiatica]|uniref:RPM1 interacting protein 4 transcript 2 n=1 Tax=Striga asiatica TaxID=4170 RepID=A0A5A7R2L2_STRAF|nr:RPM1 interacting protein 4 transcript 2 [Striga asiatica]
MRIITLTITPPLLSNQRSSVPKFGNWENDDNVPYTVYFDKARKNRGGGKVINPNDPQENPDMFPNNDPSSKSRTKSDEPIGPGPEHRTASKEDSDFKRFTNSPARAENMGQRSTKAGRPTRRSEGSEQGFERSPLHPHYQAKVTGRVSGSGSPSWEGKNHDSSHGTPGRSRLKPTSRGDESPEKGAAIPKFGEWDESDPQAAENFTHIFNKVREERNTGPTNVSGTPKHPSYGARPQQSKDPKVG